MKSILSLFLMLGLLVPISTNAAYLGGGEDALQNCKKAVATTSSVFYLPDPVTDTQVSSVGDERIAESSTATSSEEAKLIDSIATSSTGDSGESSQTAGDSRNSDGLGTSDKNSDGNAGELQPSSIERVDNSETENDNGTTISTVSSELSSGSGGENSDVSGETSSETCSEQSSIESSGDSNSDVSNADTGDRTGGLIALATVAFAVGILMTAGKKED